MNHIQTPSYRNAFIQYLRKGTPIDFSMKAAPQPRTTSHYIWRTRGDGKVRSTHAVNNGKIFSWDVPPETGHPGEDYNCRCTAEPYVRGESEFAEQAFITPPLDQPLEWDDYNFLSYFIYGNGVALTLSETGHLAGVIDYYFYTLGKYDRINAQIIDEARNHSSGGFEYFFYGAADFEPYLFSIGDATVAGLFSGTVLYQDGTMYIQGNIHYKFFDTYTDLAGERERLIGTSDPSVATPEMLNDTEYGGTYFDILGIWNTTFIAEAKKEEASSRYQWQ